MIRALIWTFSSNFLPLVVGLVTIPMMIDSFGLELFGLLTIIWALVGYMSLFDLGLGRALTFAVANQRTSDDGVEALSRTASTGMALVSGLALVAGGVLFVLANPLAVHVFGISADHVAVGAQSLRVSAVAVSFTIISNGFRGILEGFGEFGKVAVGRIPLGVWMFVGPLVIFNSTGSFVLGISALVFARFVITIYYYSLCRRWVKIDGSSIARGEAALLINFGGWMTVSNIISPVMVYFDRIFIASFLGMKVVAFYTVPQEIITKILLIPASIGTVFFPKFSAYAGSTDTSQPGVITSIAYGLNFFLTVPATVVLYFYGEKLLTAWINPDVAAQSAGIAFILSLGVVFNALASVPYSLIQARGDAKTTALIHLVEAPIYVACLLYVMWGTRYGITGVAWVWVGRMLADWIALEVVVRRIRHG